MRKRKPTTVASLLARTAPAGDCLEWQGCLNTDGYARMAYEGNYNGKVHRIIYSLLHPEEDIEDKVIRHTCDNIKCINPDHLLSGTPAENSLDKCVRGRDVLAKLSPEKVIEIRSLYATGEYTQEQLGNLFNVNHRTIQSVTSNKTWRWVKTKED